ANYGKPGTEWEKTAKERLHFHDMQPERVAYR
ncbi:MAG: NADPH-dependent 7-cyano-7-deazaguanine reductase QueF, partial [Veillonella sp.]|nr:NADPH-dependent 7-cyano-7-deazaguanine reductase QueF [Veillonella sp.]